MPRTSKEETRRVQCNVLSYLADRAEKSRSVPNVSYREISDALGYSQARVRHACRRLVASECVRRNVCYAEDGGQRANAYAVTPKGWSLIKDEQMEAHVAKRA